MADLVKFVSKSQLDEEKQKRREAREIILRKVSRQGWLLFQFYNTNILMQLLKQAKEDYEKKERQLEAKRQRGEDVWMLPSVNQRLSGSSSEDEVCW